jgi:hypothetical protein
VRTRRPGLGAGPSAGGCRRSPSSTNHAEKEGSSRHSPAVPGRPPCLEYECHAVCLFVGSRRGQRHAWARSPGSSAVPPVVDEASRLGELPHSAGLRRLTANHLSGSLHVQDRGGNLVGARRIGQRRATAASARLASASRRRTEMGPRSVRAHRGARGGDSVIGPDHREIGPTGGRDVSDGPIPDTHPPAGRCHDPEGRTYVYGSPDRHDGATPGQEMVPQP